MKGVQCYELFGGIALKNHAFSFSFHLTLSLKEQAPMIYGSQLMEQSVYVDMSNYLLNILLDIVAMQLNTENNNH